MKSRAFALQLHRKTNTLWYLHNIGAGVVVVVGVSADKDTTQNINYIDTEDNTIDI